MSQMPIPKAAICATAEARWCGGRCSKVDVSLPGKDNSSTHRHADPLGDQVDSDGPVVRPNKSINSGPIEGLGLRGRSTVSLQQAKNPRTVVVSPRESGGGLGEPVFFSYWVGLVSLDTKYTFV